MDHAFLIVGHVNPGQIARLVRRVGAPGSTVLLHLDRRMPTSDVTAVMAGSAPVEPILLRRSACPWGTFGFVEATLRGMAALMGLNRGFTHLSVLSGQDYPIKKPDHIAETLAADPMRSFMEGRPLPHPGWAGERGGWPRVERWHLRVRHRHLALRARRAVPAGFVAAGGSAWWTMSRAAVQVALQTVRRRPEIIRFFRHADIPDELFFQTVLLSSPLRDQVVDDNLRYIRWDENRLHVTGRPDTLTTDDIAALRRSPALFARKFDPKADPDVLDRIDAELLAAA